MARVEQGVDVLPASAAQRNAPARLKILALDHAFHTKTASSAFFFSALAPYADVTLRYFDPEEPAGSLAALSDIDWKGFDLVIVWQLDVLALLPMSAGVPTLIVPMFDGSGGQPAEHWRLLRGASALNFSYNLHLATRGVLANSQLVKYFPDPAGFEPVKDFSTLRAFFWQRNPAEIDAAAAFRLLRGPVASWHVHLAADQGEERPVAAPPAAPLTTSSWFASRRDFDTVLDCRNVAVCPRRAEGIGMFMLECMARGMCVVASCLPVHSEYISDGVTGLLFDPYNPKPVSLKQAAAIGARARRTVELGHAAFLKQMAALPDFVRLAARTRPTWAPKPAKAKRLIEVYFKNEPAYHKQARDLVFEGAAPAEGVVPAASEPQPPAEPLARNVQSGSWSIEKWRSRMQLLPGWARMKSIVPNVWKRRIVDVLVRLSPY